MKRKKLNSILLVVVLLIWFKVAYNFFRKNTKPTEYNIEKKADLTPSIGGGNKQEKLKLFYPTKDPFLSITKREKVVQKKRITKKTRLTKNTIWPEINYLGMIKKRNGEILALLKVDGEFTKMKIKTAKPNYSFKILKIFRDSIFVKNDNSKKVIKKE